MLAMGGRLANSDGISFIAPNDGVDAALSPTPTPFPGIFLSAIVIILQVRFSIL